MEQINAEKVYKELELLKKAVFGIQEYLEDCFLTAEEEMNIEKAREELEARETYSLEDIEQMRKNAEN